MKGKYFGTFSVLGFFDAPLTVLSLFLFVPDRARGAIVFLAVEGKAVEVGPAGGDPEARGVVVGALS